MPIDPTLFSSLPYLQNYILRILYPQQRRMSIINIFLIIKLSLQSKQYREVYRMVAETIKTLRKKNNLSQSSLAKKLNVTRSSVNAWEMGISVPSAPLIVKLAKLFQVSVDYLLGIKESATLDISALNEKEIMILYELIGYFKSLK